MKTMRNCLLAVAIAGASACGMARADWLWARTVVPGVGAVRTIAYGNGLFVAGTGSGYMLSSRDGVNWAVTRPTLQSITEIVFGNGRFVAAVNAVSGSKCKIIYSADGASWIYARRTANQGRFSSSSNLTALASKGGKFIGLGPSSNAFATSNSGTRWQNPIKSGKPAKYVGSVSGLAVNGGYILCSTQSGATVQSSPDGFSWTTEFSGASKGPARGIASERPGKRLVVVGENGLCLVSSNGGDTWRSKPFGSVDFQGIAYANKLFIGVGDKFVYSSPGGIGWTRQLRVSRSGDHLRAIGGGAGLYLAVGSNGKNGLLMVSSGIPAPPATP